MKDNVKKNQKLQSPLRQDEKLNKGANSERKRSTNVTGMGKPTRINARHAEVEKLDIYDKATSAKQAEESSKEDVHAGHEKIRYASTREITPNNSMGEVF